MKKNWDTVDHIYTSMFHFRVPNIVFESIQYRCTTYTRKDKGLIADLLKKGFKVRSGWYPTSIRGYHEHYIYYKIK